MAENKRSFLLYCDLLHMVNKLPDEIAGRLFKTILSYVNDENPEPDDVLLQIAFEPIKQQLKRDLKKWEIFRNKQSQNGKLGGRPKSTDKKQPKTTQKSQAFSDKAKESQKSLSVSVNDSVIVSDSERVIGPPTQKQAEDFFLACGSSALQGRKFYLHYKAKDFKDITDWAALAQKWILQDTEQAKQNSTW